MSSTVLHLNCHFPSQKSYSLYFNNEKDSCCSQDANKCYGSSEKVFSAHLPQPSDTYAQLYACPAICLEVMFVAQNAFSLIILCYHVNILDLNLKAQTKSKGKISFPQIPPVSSYYTEEATSIYDIAVWLKKCKPFFYGSENTGCYISEPRQYKEVKHEQLYEHSVAVGKDSKAE